MQTRPFPKVNRPAQYLYQNLGGDDRVRTDDLRLARAALSQLSYIPGNSIEVGLAPSPFQSMVVGPSGLEPPTSRLSGVRSNQLSYGPAPRCGATVAADPAAFREQSPLSYAAP